MGAGRDDVSGRRKVENEKETGQRKRRQTGNRGWVRGEGGGMGNVKRAEGGRHGRARQDTLPSERWKAFQPESTLAQLCFLFGGGCGVAGRAGAPRGWVGRGDHRAWVVGSSVVARKRETETETETERERERERERESRMGWLG